MNHFSDNYNKIDEKSSSLIRVMYRIKKYQYVFYKHFLLHGLNITVALKAMNICDSEDFRWYWLLLNTSYVMEFFMQTLVKKNYMRQDVMLGMQVLLMSAASSKAFTVLSRVNPYVAVLSLVLNFAFRKFDVVNTVLIMFIYSLGTNLYHNLFST